MAKPLLESSALCKHTTTTKDKQQQLKQLRRLCIGEMLVFDNISYLRVLTLGLPAICDEVTPPALK